MKKYIALLRGINVGGKNKIAMPELKEAFKAAGFSDVISYINSGNIIFSTACANENELATQCEALITNRFKLNIPVMIISAENLQAALKNAPAWWTNDASLRHDAFFVLPPVTAQEIMAQVGDINPLCEKIGFYGQVIFWTVSRDELAKSKWRKIASTPAFSKVTVRNANTTKKLLQLAE